jgi:hypothetical protein
MVIFGYGVLVMINSAFVMVYRSLVVVEYVCIVFTFTVARYTMTRFACAPLRQVKWKTSARHDVYYSRRFIDLKSTSPSQTTDKTTVSELEASYLLNRLDFQIRP